MDLIETLRKHEKEMKERFAVKRIGAFGSFIRGEQKETSDIDLVVEFENPTFDNFMDLAFYLEDLTGRSVDSMEAIKRIKAYSDKIDYDKFLGDIKTQDAVVRNIEIIGEVVKNISPDFKERYETN
jgi:predicted nucleotidyltransferase